jgi:polyhydroxyalkanoate synthase subunit PhaC
VLAASGHIAGMINPPSAGKGGYWSDETDDAAAAGTAAAWLVGAKKREGSWWGDWTKWLEVRSGKRMPAAAVGSAAYPPIQDAPGSYVLEK